MSQSLQGDDDRLKQFLDVFFFVENRYYKRQRSCLTGFLLLIYFVNNQTQSDSRAVVVKNMSFFYHFQSRSATLALAKSELKCFRLIEKMMHNLANLDHSGLGPTRWA